MSEKDRIRLANAVGESSLITRFDPFTNANDDYAVLEWMRENYTPEEIETAFDHIGYGHRWAYGRGNNGEAALVLIDGRHGSCPDCASLRVIKS